MTEKHWILMAPGGIETRYPTIEDATTAGERFLLDHPSECRIAIYELGEDGHEDTTRLIFHWRDEYFHYLETDHMGKTLRKIFVKPCHPPVSKNPAGRSGS